MTIKTYTRRELTEILQVSMTSVGTLINDGKIFSVRVGNSIRVPEWALDDFLHGRPAYIPDDPLAEPDNHENPTDSLLRDDDHDKGKG